MLAIVVEISAGNSPKVKILARRSKAENHESQKTLFDGRNERITIEPIYYDQLRNLWTTSYDLSVDDVPEPANLLFHCLSNEGPVEWIYDGDGVNIFKKKYLHVRETNYQIKKKKICS